MVQGGRRREKRRAGRGKGNEANFYKRKGHRRKERGFEAFVYLKTLARANLLARAPHIYI